MTQGKELTMLAERRRGPGVRDQVSTPPRQLGRRGEVAEVVAEPGHRRCRVEWEDGEETLVYPGTSATVERFQPDRRLVLR
jgi:hypothetical protein